MGHLFSPSLYQPLLQSQQQHHHFYESHSQSLSQDEWALITTLRKMNNLSVSSPLEPPPSSLAHQESGNLISHQSSSSDQTGHQIQLSPHYGTTPISTRSYVSSTALQQLLSVQQVPYPPTQTQELLSTAASQPSKISANIESEQVPLSLQIPSPQQMSSPSQIQSGHQNHSPKLQTQSHPSSVSPPTIISPVQKQQQKSLDRSISTSPHQSPSAYPRTPAIFHYNPTITGPMVQLLDPTKPYELGDTIKIGRHVLKSDTLSMKY